MSEQNNNDFGFLSDLYKTSNTDLVPKNAYNGVLNLITAQKKKVVVENIFLLCIVCSLIAFYVVLYPASLLTTISLGIILVLIMIFFYIDRVGVALKGSHFSLPSDDFLRVLQKLRKRKLVLYKVYFPVYCMLLLISSITIWVEHFRFLSPILFYVILAFIIGYFGFFFATRGVFLRNELNNIQSQIDTLQKTKVGENE